MASMFRTPIPNQKLITLLFLLLGIIISYPGEAQDSLDESEPLTRKEYRAKKKQLKDSARVYYWNLERLEEVLDEQTECAKKDDLLAKAHEEINILMGKMIGYEDQIAALEARNRELEGLLAQNKPNLPEDFNPPANLAFDPESNPEGEKALEALSEENAIPLEGTYFSVQVGAYYQDQEAYVERQLGTAELITEKKDGLFKYLLGLFAEYENAEVFRQKLLQGGMAKQAWVVGYQDGVRVPVSTLR